MTELLAEGLGLGLSTGLYCLGACAPLFIPYLLAEGRQGFKPNLWLVLKFILGRLAAYLLFALVFSLLGKRYGIIIPDWALGACLLISGILLFLYSLIRNAPHLGICGPLSRILDMAQLPFLFGFLVGINICPPFMAGLVRILELRDVASGLAYFTAFFAGTTLYMIPLLAAAPLARIERLKSIAAIASSVAGLWFSTLGIYKLIE